MPHTCHFLGLQEVRQNILVGLLDILVCVLWYFVDVLCFFDDIIDVFDIGMFYLLYFVSGMVLCGCKKVTNVRYGQDDMMPGRQENRMAGEQDEKSDLK